MYVEWTCERNIRSKFVFQTLLLSDFHSLETADITIKWACVGFLRILIRGHPFPRLYTYHMNNYNWGGTQAKYMGSQFIILQGSTGYFYVFHQNSILEHFSEHVAQRPWWIYIYIHETHAWLSWDEVTSQVEDRIWRLKATFFWAYESTWTFVWLDVSLPLIPAAQEEQELLLQQLDWQELTLEAPEFMVMRNFKDIGI